MTHEKAGGLKRAMTTIRESQLTLDERFFYENAGYSYDPKTESMDEGRARCARALAKAEADGKAAGLFFEWSEDLECGPDDFEFEEDKEHVRSDGARCCTAFVKCDVCGHGVIKASLCGITESLDNRARDNYRRVVEAELAMEAIG